MLRIYHIGAMTLMPLKVVQPYGIESVDGSDINMGCTSLLVDSDGVMICDSCSNNYPIDGKSPAIDTSTSDWASQLVTVRKTQSDRVTLNGTQFDHVLLTFGFDTAVTLTGIELDLFLCPDMYINAPNIRVFANDKSNLTFTYDPLNNNNFPYQSYPSTPSDPSIESLISCDSLSTVNITLSSEFFPSDKSFFTWHVLITSFLPSVDWVYVGEVRFLSMDDTSPGRCTCICVCCMILCICTVHVYN